MRFPTVVIALCGLLVLTACGGGGGGNGTASNRGGFTLERSSLSFSAVRDGTLPAAQLVGMTVTGSEVALVGAGYRDRPDPGWLTVEISGSHPAYQIRLSVTDTQRQGTLETVLTIGTADEDGNLLFTRELAVRYTLSEQLSVRTLGATTYQAILGHSDSGLRTAELVVSGASDTRWRLGSDQAWLQLPAETFSGDRSLGYTVDLSALGDGFHSATVEVHNVDDPSERAQFSVSVQVDLPRLLLDASGLVFGDALGRQHSAQTLGARLDTGSTLHPLGLVIDDSITWLGAAPHTGQISGTPTSLRFEPQLDGLAPGSYATQIFLVATVNGVSITSEAVDVVLHLDAQRLSVEAHGVGFSQLPDRAVLERRLLVSSTWPDPTLRWRARSEATWLSVTTEGAAGEPLTLRADPQGLASDTLHRTRVRLESADGRVGSVDTVEVGLWVGSTAAPTVSLETPGSFLIADPVRPLLYLSAGTDTVTVYDVYSGDIVEQLRPGVAQAQRLAISDDGRWLYVHDAASGRVRVYDRVHHTRGSLLETERSAGQDLPLLALHRHGVPLLIAGSRVYRIGDEIALLAQGQGFDSQLAASADGARLVGQNSGLSPSSYQLWSLDYSEREGGWLQLLNRGGGSGGSNGRDIALSSDGRQLYTANGGYYAFPVFDTDSGALLAERAGVPYPNAVETHWNGLFVGGADAYYEPHDLFVYAADGRELARLRASADAGYASLKPEGVRLSADGTRVLAISESNGSGAAPVLSFQSLPPP